eukprot:m51a1_g5306 hypothetical protein (293) ;mRNA; r:267628-268837
MWSSALFLSLVLLYGMALGSCSSGIAPGAISVNLQGRAQSLGVVQVGGSNGRLRVSGTAMTGQHNIRGYIANGCPSSWASGIYHSFPLLGHKLSYTVDLSTVHCGCNAAFYLVSMPGYDASGKAARSEQGDYYCDANKVGGVYCPEIDLMEANQYAFSVALHKCNSPTNKYYSWCDGGGCGKNFASISGAYGPGSGYKINTKSPFTVTFDFQQSSGKLSNVVATLAQGSKSVSMDFKSCGTYLQDLTAPLKAGMVATLSHWGDGTMSWLDGQWCSAACDKSGRVTVSGIKWT